LQIYKTPIRVFLPKNVVRIFSFGISPNSDLAEKSPDCVLLKFLSYKIKVLVVGRSLVESFVVTSSCLNAQEKPAEKWKEGMCENASRKKYDKEMYIKI
jgi:hypothetical protein